MRNVVEQEPWASVSTAFLSSVPNFQECTWHVGVTWLQASEPRAPNKHLQTHKMRLNDFEHAILIIMIDYREKSYHSIPDILTAPVTLARQNKVILVWKVNVKIDKLLIGRTSTFHISSNFMLSLKLTQKFPMLSKIWTSPLLIPNTMFFPSGDHSTFVSCKPLSSFPQILFPSTEPTITAPNI